MQNDKPHKSVSDVMSPLLHVQTPLIEDAGLSKRLGKTILLKMECCQPIGSFKIRGVGLLCQRLKAKGYETLVSSSGGNAGYAVAYAGRKLGLAVTVVVPGTTPPATRKRLENEGADVIVKGSVWDETDIFARKMAKAHDAAYVPPFDHPTLWEGHAGLIDEIAAVDERPDMVITSVGGGGLMCGVLEGLHRNGWRDVDVVAVETHGADSLDQSVRAGSSVTLPGITSIAKSLGAKRVADAAFEWTKRHAVKTVVVSDQSSIKACLRFADDHRVLVEPACGAALSLIYDEHPSIRDAKRIVVVVCGGISTSMDLLQKWDEEFLDASNE